MNHNEQDLSLLSDKGVFCFVDGGKRSSCDTPSCRMPTGTLPPTAIQQRVPLRYEPFARGASGACCRISRINISPSLFGARIPAAKTGTGCFDANRRLSRATTRTAMGRNTLPPNRILPPIRTRIAVAWCSRVRTPNRRLKVTLSPSTRQEVLLAVTCSPAPDSITSLFLPCLPPACVTFLRKGTSRLQSDLLPSIAASADIIIILRPSTLLSQPSGAVAAAAAVRVRSLPSTRNRRTQDRTPTTLPFSIPLLLRTVSCCHRWPTRRSIVIFIAITITHLPDL
jgi:hypothetical protein